MNLQPAETPEDVAAFEADFDAYLVNDILPHTDFGEPLTEEGLQYFRSARYRDTITVLCARETDPVHRYFVMRDGVKIGFILCCTYHSEDGKCFIMEMSIFQAFRGQGLGREAFRLLQTAENAKFYELSTSTTRARRFWESLGFHALGLNAEGSFMMELRSGLPVDGQPEMPDNVIG